MPYNLTYVNGVLVISVVAWSNSGKTTLFEKVVSELESRGIKVGVIKHHSTQPLLMRWEKIPGATQRQVQVR